MSLEVCYWWTRSSKEAVSFVLSSPRGAGFSGHVRPELCEEH